VSYEKNRERTINVFAVGCNSNHQMGVIGMEAYDQCRSPGSLNCKAKYNLRVLDYGIEMTVRHCIEKPEEYSQLGWKDIWHAKCLLGLSFT
jgi:hypothetical protein